ncbi:MAG: menaquinone biosynthesis protein [Saprospiraceae bacterium]|nr:menaquinone biosynthesis protein [Saprospiraceae bacterium]
MMRISLVDYLNSKPYAIGLQAIAAARGIEVLLEHPAQCADRLRQQGADLGLVPVALLHDLPDLHVFHGWGIGCLGPVESVCLVSQLPVNQLEQILLDEESRTSNLLIQLLCRDFWKIHPRFSDRQSFHPDMVTGGRGALLIGDRAIAMKHQFEHCYDLGEVWYQHTGLPFVFAVWAGHQILSQDQKEMLDGAFRAGMESIDHIAIQSAPDYPDFDVRRYLRSSIVHEFTDAHQQGLETFLTQSKSIIKNQKLETI